MVEEEKGEFRSRDVGTGWDDLYIRSKAISEGNSAVETFIWRQRSYEVDGDGVTTLIWNRKRVQGAGILGGLQFIALTVRAGRDVSLFQVTSHIWPVVSISEGFVWFVETEVTQVIVALFNAK